MFADFEALGEAEVLDRLERKLYPEAARIYAIRWLNDKAIARSRSVSTGWVSQPGPSSVFPGARSFRVTMPPEALVLTTRTTGTSASPKVAAARAAAGLRHR